jgi:asparagine synthase (glutamine-hydrolysing)
MTGNYGSQVLRPFAPTFRPSDVSSGVFVPDLSPHFTEAHRTYRALLGRHPVSFAAFCQAPWYHYGLYAVELSQLTVRSPFLDNSLVRTAFGAPHSSLTSADPCLRLIGDGNPALLRIRTDRGLAGDGGRIPAAIRRAFLETTFKAEYAYDYGMPQWVVPLDHALSMFHPERLFLGRHKYSHFRIWYRDALAGYVREMLLDPRTLSRLFWQRKAVEAVVDDHLASRRNCTWALHKLLTLELVHRLFVD